MTEKSEHQTPSHPKPFKSDPDEARLKKKAILAFGILLIGIFAVLILLPAMLEEKEKPVVAQMQPEAVSVEDLARAKEIQELVQAILKHRAELENDGIQVWGKEKLEASYGEVLTLMQEADTDVSEKRMEEALEKYRDVRDKLKQLEASRPQRFEFAMQAGNEAYGKLDGPSAVFHYEIAVAANPEHTEAQIRLERAGKLPEILNLIQEGQNLEQNDKWEAALGKYSQALELDAEFTLARKHFERLDVAISERLFRQSMTDAASALTHGDLQQSRSALDIAKSLKPDSGDVDNLQQQLSNMEMRTEHQKLGRDALQYELDEDWEKASQTYEQILQLDPKDGFALQGQKHAEEQLAVIREIQEYLDQPDLLQEPEYRQHAQKINELAAGQQDAGQKLRDLNDGLKTLLDQYNNPVPVVLRSDGFTNVRIYHVRQFGPSTLR